MMNPTPRIDLPFPQNLPVIDNDFDEDGLDVNYFLDEDLRDAEIMSFHDDLSELEM